MKTLHNDHNVYILGAGFSADRGLPLVKDFTFHMRDAYDWLLQQKRRQEANAIASVLQFRLEAASASYRVKIDLENIEELFSLASASTDTGNHAKLAEDIRIAIAATLDYCSNKSRYEATYHLRTNSGDEIPGLTSYSVPSGAGYKLEYKLPAYEFYLRAMLGFQGNPENTLISFNYDTVVEETLTKLNLGFSYGFGPKTVNYKTQHLKLSNDNLKLLKLHGSINWGRQTNATTGGAGKLSIFDSYADVRSNRAIPDLIPPTWRKVFDGNLEGLWVHALEAIKTATQIIVIGFSVPETDLHFKYLLAAGLKSNISLRDIVFVNPEHQDVLQKKIDGLFTNPQYSRVTHKQHGTWEYFCNMDGRTSCNRHLNQDYDIGRY